MIILNEHEMWNAVTYEESMHAIEKAYSIHRSGRFVMPDRMIAKREENLIMYMPCFVDDMIGTKMLSEFPGNTALGLPYLSGLMILNDAKTGVPRAVMNGNVLTAMRTGAAGGLAMRHLARKDASSVGLVGCGVQGFWQVVYACQVRPIQEIYLYDVPGKDLHSFVERLKRKTNIADSSIHICENVRMLCKKSDILISCTQATYPVFPDDQSVLEGKCIIAIGSWRPERRELPDAVWKLVNCVYTEIPYAMEETGDLKIPLATGMLTPDRVRYMEELLEERSQGQEPVLSETRCFKSVGMGLYDVCMAQLIYEKAIENGTGQKIEW